MVSLRFKFRHLSFTARSLHQVPYLCPIIDAQDMSAVATTRTNLASSYVVRGLTQLSRSDQTSFGVREAAADCLNCLSSVRAGIEQSRRRRLVRSTFNTENASDKGRIEGNAVIRSYLKIGAHILSMGTTTEIREQMSRLGFDCEMAYRLSGPPDGETNDTLTGSAFAQKIDNSADRYLFWARSNSGKEVRKTIGEEGLSDRLGIVAIQRETTERRKPCGPSVRELEDLTAWIVNQPNGTFVKHHADGDAAYDVSDACRSAATLVRGIFNYPCSVINSETLNSARDRLRKGTLLDSFATPEEQTHTCANEAYLACQLVGRILMLHDPQRQTAVTLSEQRSDWASGALASCAIDEQLIPDLTRSHWFFPAEAPTADLYDLVQVKGEDALVVEEVTAGRVTGTLP